MTSTSPTGPGLDRRQFVGLAAGTVLTAGAGVFSGCFGDDDSTSSSSDGSPAAGRPGGTMGISLTGGAAKETLDPAKTFSITEIILSGALYGGLTVLKRGRGWTAEPQLATKWSHNADLTEWRFQLRDGVEFHDGKELTARDVVYTIQRVLDPKVGSIVLGRLAPVLDPDGVTALGNDEVRFRLRRPDAFFPVAMGARQAKILPDGYDDFSTAQGTGPFTLERFEPGQGFEISKNPSYWNAPLPNLDGVRCSYSSDESALAQNVLTGDTDFGGSFDYSVVPTVENRDEAILTADQGALFANIVADQTQPPFDDPRVLQALKLVQDRERIREAVQFGYGVLTSDLPVRSTDEFYPPSLGVRPQDLEQARSLLAEAGHPDGLDLTLYTSSAYPGMVDLATVFAEQAGAAGFNVEVQQRPAETYFDRVYMKEPFFVTVWILRFPFDAMSVTFGKDSPVNESHYDDPEFDELLAQTQRTASVEDQRESLGEAQIRVADNAGWLCPTLGAFLYLRKPNVQNVTFNPTDTINFETATIA